MFLCPIFLVFLFISSYFNVLFIHMLHDNSFLFYLSFWINISKFKIRTGNFLLFICWKLQSHETVLSIIFFWVSFTDSVQIFRGSDCGSREMISVVTFFRVIEVSVFGIKKFLFIDHYFPLEKALFVSFDQAESYKLCGGLGNFSVSFEKRKTVKFLVYFCLEW